MLIVAVVQRSGNCLAQKFVPRNERIKEFCVSGKASSAKEVVK